MSQLEQIVQMFDAIDENGRRYVLGVLRMEYERVQRTRRPALQLIDSSPASARTSAATALRPVLAIVAAGRQT